MKLVLASQNRGKLREMEAILSRYGIEVCLQSDLGVQVDVEETGATFEENSRLKAQAVFEATGLAAIADDSGLEVDALGGAPGVYSARYGGDACADDEARNDLLLRNLEGVENRTARFVSAITCVMPDGCVLTARGECEGVILHERMGTGGFGYDPLFYVPEEGESFASLPAERKNRISHRARALERFEQLLLEYKETCHAD